MEEWWWLALWLKREPGGEEKERVEKWWRGYLGGERRK